MPEPALQAPASLFRDRISAPLVRILRVYVALITSFVMVLMVAATYSYAVIDIEHQRDKLLQRLTNEATTQIDELNALAHSPLLWTGLTDSKGREVYLEPLLERFNRGGTRQFTVLDYRGRMVLGPARKAGEESAAPDITTEPAVLAAVREGRNGFGLRTVESGVPQVLLVHRITDPESEVAVGFLVALIDTNILVRRLGLNSGLSLSVTVGDLAMARPTASRWMYSAEGRGQGGYDDLIVPIRVWIGKPVYASAAVTLTGLAIALVLGLWMIRRVNAWARRFAATTTQRLDRLLVECQKILAGEVPDTVEAKPDDELSKVTEALNAMMLNQRRFTDELRTTSLVFSTAAEGILVTDPQGRITQANAALLAMTGYAREELIGQQAGSLYRLVGDREAGRRMASALGETGRWNGETTFIGRDQQAIPTSVAISRISDDGNRILGNVAVITDIRRLKEVENRLRQLADVDALTGLRNFRNMSEQVQQMLDAARATSQRYAVAFLDLDNFKAINDDHGHDAGDAVIQAVARHLSERLPPGHLLCRRSGDEFIALIDRAGETDDDLEALLRRLMPLTVPTDAGALRISFTMGVSRFPEDATEWRELQICADMAMNEAKQERRGSIVWYDPQIGRRLHRRRQIEGRLRQAIENREIEVHYQPEVDLRNGRVIGFEALARWADPELGPVSPSEFIPAAEEARLIEALTLCVATRVLRDKPLLQQRFPGAMVAFNVSPQVLRGSALLEFFSDQSLIQEGILEGLEIELTETQIARSSPRLQLQVQALVGMGVRLVIDDFGTGYSSLSRLTQFPISRLKIDRSFVQGLDRTRGTRIALLIIDLAKVLGFEVTAEGVETADQCESLVRMGCVRGQGWLFAKALPAADWLGPESPVRFPARSG